MQFPRPLRQPKPAFLQVSYNIPLNMSSLSRQAFNTTAPLGFGFDGSNTPYPSGTPYQFAPPSNLFAPQAVWPCLASPAFTDSRYISASADATNTTCKSSYLRVLHDATAAPAPAAATPAALASVASPVTYAAAMPSALATTASPVTYTPLSTSLTGDQLYTYCTQVAGPCGNRPDSGSGNPCTDYTTCATECYQNKRIPTCGDSGAGPGSAGVPGGARPVSGGARPVSGGAGSGASATSTVTTVTYSPVQTKLAGDQLYKYCTTATGPCGNRPDSGPSSPCTDYTTCATECYQNKRIPTCSGGGGMVGAATYSNVAWRTGTTAAQKTGICTTACQTLGQGANDYTGCDTTSCLSKCTNAMSPQMPANCTNPTYQQYLAGVSGQGGSSVPAGSPATHAAMTAAALIASIDPSL